MSLKMSLNLSSLDITQKYAYQNDNFIQNFKKLLCIPNIKLKISNIQRFWRFFLNNLMIIFMI